MTTPPTDIYACPTCAEKIQKDARQCRFCATDLNWQVVLSRPPKIAHKTEFVEELLRLNVFATHTTESLKKICRAKSLLAKQVSFFQAEEIQKIAVKYAADVAIQFQSRSSAQKWLQPFLRTTSVMIPLSFAVIAIVIGVFKFVKPELQNLLLPAALNKTPQPTTTMEEGTPAQLPPPASNPLTESPGDVNFDKLIAASVTIQAGNNMGSGFFVHPEGYLMTNHHVVGNQSNITVRMFNGQRAPAKVLDVQPEFDLAIVKANVSGAPYMKLGDAALLKPGQTVWSIGAPSGLEFTVNKGIVSFVGRNLNGRIMIQVDTPINQGNSGGPLISSAGEVVGVNTATLAGKDGLHFSVPINFTYMGDQALLKPLFGYVADTPKIAEWRSKNNPVDMAKYTPDTSAVIPPVSAPPSNENFTRSAFADQVNAYTEFAASVNAYAEQQTAKIESLTAQLNALKKKYNAMNGSVSEDQQLGQNVAALTKQILNEQINLSNQVLTMNQTKKNMLNELLASAPNEAHKNQALKALETVQKDYAYFTNLKQQTQKQLKETDATVY